MLLASAVDSSEASRESPQDVQPPASHFLTGQAVAYSSAPGQRPLRAGTVEQLPCTSEGKLDKMGHARVLRETWPRPISDCTAIASVLWSGGRSKLGVRVWRQSQESPLLCRAAAKPILRTEELCVKMLACRFSCSVPL